MNKYVKTLNEYANELNEKKIVLKRKYTDEHPAEKVYTNLPVRNKMLSFIGENGAVTYSELKEFVEILGEELGKKPSSVSSWISKNRKFIIEELDEATGERVFSLSKLGKKILLAIGS